MTGPTVGTGDTSGKHAWTPPTLTVLGDAAAVTELGGAPTPDATGGS
jgi:hypothetical protein